MRPERFAAATCRMSRLRVPVRAACCSLKRDAIRNTAGDIAAGQVRLGPRPVRVHQVTRHEEAAVRVEARPLQDASSPRSSNTRFGSTRSPTIRFARASTSGHRTRVSVRLDGGRAPRFASRARSSRTRRARCRVGRALTCFRSCVGIMPSWYVRQRRTTSSGDPPSSRRTKDVTIRWEVQVLILQKAWEGAHGSSPRLAPVIDGQQPFQRRRGGI